jgi:hypothetical protein
MPNDCWNRMCVACDNKDEFKNFVNNEMLALPSDNKENTYHETIEHVVITEYGSRFMLWTPNQPDFEWLTGLLEKYPTLWIKDEWIEEGGIAGVWVGWIDKETHEPVVHQTHWLDLTIEGYDFHFKTSQL